ncbi:MAG: universal stress protein [Acidimicrobiia bacterium]|nr:universal stress protein [Acidimicrobiia bacterium]MDH4308898.1 universal stress protein [Acidimicrobiia bacterium]MDH5295087.1 universal stress protein [Acidimicrobiia bacterium]
MTPVLAAIDLGASAPKVAAKAIEIGKALGLTVVPVHALTPERLEDYRESLPQEGAFVDVLMSRLGADVMDHFAGHQGVSQARVLVGEAAETVLDEANSVDASYIVIGIRNRSRVGKLLMGSVAQEILLDSPCPVVGVPV